MSTFDSAVVAGLYSTLCGVLAGFAVSGLTFVVAILARDRRHNRHDPTEHSGRTAIDDPEIPLALLTSAFIGLTLASLAYGLMAGEPSHSPRLATDQVIAGFGLGSGFLLLMLAVLKLVCGVAPDLNSWLTRVVGLGAPCLVWLYLAEGTRYVGETFEPDQRLLWSCLGVTGALQVAAMIAASRLRRRRLLPPHVFRRIASLGVIIPTISTALVAMSPTLFPHDSPPPMWAMYAILTIGVLGTATFTLEVGRTGQLND